jgi:hypothetical protein
LHIVAMQHASFPQAPVPVQSIVQVSPLHDGFSSHAPVPVHWMSHRLAVHVTPPSHVEVVSHTTVQLAPPHVITPSHALVDEQLIWHSDACEQSMGPLHELTPQLTSQGMPWGHVTPAAQEPLCVQSITHVSP